MFTSLLDEYLELLLNIVQFYIKEIHRRFYGPPTNCFDLSQLGYTLNGVYMVKLANITIETKVEPIYCAFEQPEGTNFCETGNDVTMKDFDCCTYYFYILYLMCECYFHSNIAV